MIRLDAVGFIQANLVIHTAICKTLKASTISHQVLT